MGELKRSGTDVINAIKYTQTDRNKELRIRHSCVSNLQHVGKLHDTVQDVQ